MRIPEDMRKELINTLNNPKNKTGSATIRIGGCIDEKGNEYKFGVICQRAK